MSLIDKIKEQYPSPKSARDKTADVYRDYCVGGALCLYTALQHDPKTDLREISRWPRTLQLANVLENLNPRLSSKLAYRYADIIVSQNDQEMFGEAWGEVREALEWRPV